jgi:hypothetical protein
MIFKNNERVYKFALENNGPERGSVRLEAHNPKWKRLFCRSFDLKMPLGFEVPFAGTAIYFGMDYLGAIYKSVR